MNEKLPNIRCMLRMTEMEKSGKEMSHLCAGTCTKTWKSLLTQSGARDQGKADARFIESISQGSQRAQIGEEYILQKMENNFHKTQFLELSKIRVG